MSTNTPPADGRDRTTAGYLPDQTLRAPQPLYEPLPYGAGFSEPEPLGFGVSPFGGSPFGGSPEPAPTPAGTVEVPGRRRAGSPILAVAGLASLAVAVWAILGAPVITPTVLLAAGLVLILLVGLLMVVRR